jgi:predicted NBD/HSP70 family sugar kinase
MAYLAIDIGGTKTLICKMTDTGYIEERTRFETPKSYDQFIANLTSTLGDTDLNDVNAIGVGAPGFINRKDGSVIEFGNLPWTNSPIRHEIETATNRPTVVENDAKLAGLYEAMSLDGQYNRVLYVTVSTGIGIGLTVNDEINTTISDAGGKSMFFEHADKIIDWEELASGRSILRDYGKQASDIDDPKIWLEVSKRLVLGLTQLITLTSPEIITIGGGVGAHLDKFKNILETELYKYLFPRTMKPNIPIVQAKNAEDAVIYGCYYYARTFFNNK